MIDRGNGARASKTVSVRVGREALLRKALLGSTALIGITLATPALAQSTHPAGGGTISGSGSYSNTTGSGGGVVVSGTQSAGITMAGVTIANTSGSGDAYQQQASSGQSAVLYTSGTNTLSTTASGGTALGLVAPNGNLTWAIGQLDASSTTDLTGSYGAYLAANGFINVVDFGTVSSLRNVTANGSAAVGIYANSSGSSVNLSLKAPVISGFSTGISAISSTGATVSTTGGSITATGIGISAGATSGTVDIESQSAITALTGIAATSPGPIQIITSGTGTLDSTSAGSGTGISVATNGTGTVNVSVGAAIGGTTTFSRGVSVVTSNPASALINFSNTAAIHASTASSSNYGVYLQAWSFPTGQNGALTVGADITGGSGVYTSGGAYDYVVLSGATITAAATNGVGINSGNTRSSLTNAGTITATGTGGIGADIAGIGGVLNTGTIHGAARGISLLNSTTINNQGTISGGTSAGIYGAGATIYNVGTTSLISGDTGITTTNNPLTVTNEGTITGTTWGIVSGGTLTSITSSGTISGTTGAIQLNATGTQSVNLQAGSTTTGNITATNNGTRTISVAGTLTGGYDATGGANTAVDNFTLNAGGSVSGAIALGDGNDSFSYLGGTLGSTVDGGAGTDGFYVNMGSSTNATLSQSNFTNFENFYLTTGNLTLTGSRSGGVGWTVSGGNATTFILNGSLTNIAGVAVTLTTPDLMFVQSGAQLSATGDVIYSSGNGNNIQNSGTITSGSGLSTAIAIGSGTVDNYGTITYAAGGSTATQGNGVLASSNQLSLTNHSGATLIGRWDGARANNGAYVVNDGLIQGDRFAGVEITGTSIVQNNAAGRIYGATSEGAGLLINSGAVQVTNAGQIVGTGTAGIYNGGSGLLSLSNSGTVAVGTLDGSNNYVTGGSTTAIRSGSANITNSGLIEGPAGGIVTSGALTLTNTGTINGFGIGTPNYDSVNVGGVASILNAGLIAQATYAAIYVNGGGTVTNAAGGTLAGGNGGVGGVAVNLGGVGGTFNNYGTATSAVGNGVVTGSNGGTINLFAGSTTGNVAGGSGNDTLAIYNGQVNGSAVTQSYTDAVTGATSSVTLQNAGTLAAASFGAIDLGTGNDTLQLRGTGTGAQSGVFSLTTTTGAETITKLDSGSWTLSGPAATPGVRINANGGTLTFSGTSGLTGSIYVNGGTVVASGAGVLGTATVHMVDPTVQFMTSGTYANSFVLDVAAPANSDPSIFQNTSGGMVSLTGAITTGTGTNANGQAIAAAQYVVFDGGIFNITNTSNSWSGFTTINSGATLQGSTASISGSSIVDNGTLIYNQSTTGTVSAPISGTGQLQVSGTGMVTLTGFNSYTGLTTVSGTGTRLQIGNGTNSGRISGTVSVGSGSTLIFSRNDNYDMTNTVIGAGDIEALGTVSLSGSLTNTGNLTVDSATGGQVTLSGSRSGATVSAVTLAGAGNVLRVALTGSVAGGQYLGVRLGGTGDGVDNFGSITNTGTGGDSGYGAAIGVVATSGTSTINNGSASNSTATISGQNAGINHVGSGGVVATGLLTVNNYGLIAGNLYNAIENQGGTGNLTVTNYASGRIVGQGNAGGGNGIGMGGTATLTLTNAGLIVGRSNGIATSSSVNINNSGTIATGTLSGGTSGTLTASGGNGIQAAGGTITNQAGGVIRGSFLSGSGTDTNAITSTAATTVVNSGQILGVAYGSTSTAHTNGVYILGGTGTVTNNAGGLITGGWDGVMLAGGGTLGNSGTIAGNLYFAVENAATVTNNSTGRLFGGTSGVSLLAGGTVNNSGLIAAATYDSAANSYTLTSGYGITATSGTIVNQFGATITGAGGITASNTLQLGNGGTIAASTGIALNVSGLNNTLSNTGTISGGSDATTGYGVRFNSPASGTLTNWSGALITGTPAGVLVASNNFVSIDNGGRIVGTANGSRGVYFTNGIATVTNQADGQIIGQGWGIQSTGTANINNSGFIGSGTLSGGTSGGFTVSSTGNGVVFNGGYLTNGSDAMIVGGNYGVASGGTTAVNINNLGTITGGNYAIYLTGNNDDTVSFFAGSTTNGAVALGDGNDTINWYGGTFTSIDGGNGSDRFAVSMPSSATLDLSTITSFEGHSLTGGSTLTLTGTQLATDGGWNVTGSNLVVGATGKLEMTGTGVILNDAGASLTVNAGGQLIAHGDNGVAAYAGGSVTNAGLIKSTGGFDGVITNGGTIDNQAGGRIIAAGNGVRLQAYATTLTNAGVIAGQDNGVMGSDAYQTVTNTGVIVAGTSSDTATAYWQTNPSYTTGDGVHLIAGGSVTNIGGYVNGNTTGIIVGGANGVSISGGAATISNSGTLQGNSGYGISIDTAGGLTSTITNHNGGALVGGTAAALLSGDGTVNMTNEYGSYMYGSIVSTGDGNRNIDLSGVVYGDYDASSGAGIDNVVLRGGSLYNAYLGDGDDSFTYIGGYISGLVDGGAGNDKLFADFGAGSSYNVSLSTFTGFESIGLVSGDMTLTGPSNDPGQDIYAGVGGNPAGTITFDGTSDLTGDIYVNGGSIRAATAGAFGTGTIHMIDPTATFGATGTYGNNISLEVVTPSSANPSTLNTDYGVVATLTGAITTSSAAGVDPSQDVTFGGQGTIVLTNTANSWLGTTTINSGATLQGASDTISGSAIVNNGTLNYQQAYSGTVSQDITGNGYVNVSGLAAGNTLTFAGTNSFNGTIQIADASNIAISGATDTGNLISVALGAGASSLEVTATGSLNSNSSAVNGSGADQSVFNLGSITSGSDAIFMTGANALVYNSGTITGARGFSTSSTDAQLINLAGGTITGTSYQAVYLANGGTIDNSGTIQAGIYPTIYASSGVTSITNNAGGTITGDGTVIAVYAAGSSVTNAGSITSTADTAIYLGGGGTVTNSGSIVANGNGVGVWTSAGATFTNQAGGSITGGYAGMLLDGADLVTVNLDAGSTTDRIFSSGTGNRVINIAGTLNGGYAGGMGDDAITLDTSATVNGTIDGGYAGNNTLDLTGTGSATLGDVMNIQSATKSGTGTWTLGTANDVAAWSITGGTLVTGGAMSGGASVDIATGGTLALSGNQGIGSLSGNGTVALGANTLGLLSGASSFDGTLTGTGNLLIDGADLTFGGTADYTGLTEVRTGSLTLAAGASFNPASNLLVGTAGTLDLGANNVTVALAGLQGTLNGTGTLTAAEYDLAGATVNANLGTGTVYSSGSTALNGTAAGDVDVTDGTLSLGAADRLADAAIVQVDAGATLDLGAFNDTIGTLALGGTLAGTGTLTASQYQLTGATVNANLGTGTVFNLDGSSVLNGTAAGDVSVQAGTLALGAADRLADTAAVAVAADATFDIGAYSDTIGTLALNGTLAGTGTLTAGQYQLTGATVDANLGAGTVFNLGGTSSLNGNAAGSLVVQAGTLVLNGTEGGDVAVTGGTLALGGSNRLADTATVTVATGATLDIGSANDTIAALGLNGTLAGTGTLTASQYQLTGATVNANLGAGTLFNLGGTSVLNGTAASDVSVQAGTLALGAADRLGDTATVVVASGATLNLGAYSDTVGALGLNGTLAGTGTLTAAEYDLTGATVNANLGAGNLFQLGGSSVLNGTSASAAVQVQGGTLLLGASNRLADTATVVVSTGATLNLGANSDTIAALALGGTLAGTGTLTADQYQLTAATVNANLGAGTLVNMGGTSVLNGTSAATTVTVQAGTLRLGASDRLADTATLGVASGATFDLATYNETVAALSGSGTIALGTGRLTLNSASSTAFGGSITGSGSIDKQGIGTLTLAGTFATTGRFDVSAGTLAFSGSTQGSIRVQGGTLIGGGTLAGALTVSSGTFSPGGLATGALGAINPIGTFTVGSLVASGGTLLFDFGGTSYNFASDSIKVNGTATLTGGTVQVNALTSAASDYRFQQLYTIVSATSLTGTFANGSVFATVASNPNLKWRLRYDLVANAVVLQVQKNMEFTDGVSAGDSNTLAVANALGNSTTGNASDQWADTLNAITSLSTAQRVAAFKTFSGEILADVSTATISANNLFTDLLRQRVGDGSDALIGGGFAGSSLADVRTTTTAANTFASALSGATLPGAAESDGGKAAIWGQVYGGYQKLLDDGVHSGLETTTAGVAMGLETRIDGFTAGIAGGVAQIDSDMDARYSTVSGNQYQLGGYMSYDAGGAFVAASGSWYSSDLDNKRTLIVGSATALATGDIHATGYSVGISAGYRAELGNGLRLALIGNASKVRNQQDGFTEKAAGGLGLQMASANRDLFTAGGELRLGATVKTGAGTAMPWVSMGVRYNSGDLDTVGNVRFSGAPAGTGSFGVSGTRIAPVLGTLGVGIDARASKNVRLGVALEGSAGENTREGRASVRVKIGF